MVVEQNDERKDERKLEQELEKEHNEYLKRECNGKVQPEEDQIKLKRDVETNRIRLPMQWVSLGVNTP